MGDSTGIEWTDATWNPVRGCSRTIASGAKQSGCGDGTGGGCYAERTAGRFCGPGQPYEGLVRITAKGPRWTGVVRMVPEHLADPLRWQRPRRIFVNSMSDLFHESLTDEQIAAVFGVMAAARQHTFQVLTKRARRMCEWFEWVAGKWHKNGCIHPRSIAWGEATSALRDTLARGAFGRRVDLEEMTRPRDLTWPLPNVWLGVSVENQAAAAERIPELLRTPAAVRFLSCEPLLGPVDLGPRPAGRFDCTGDCGEGTKACEDGTCAYCGADVKIAPSLDWVIAGIESGPGARDCDVAALLSLLDQCERAGVPFFAKQWRRVPGVVEAGPDSHRKPGGIIGAPLVRGRARLEFPGAGHGAA